MLHEPIDFKSLISKEAYPCISIYIDNHSVWPDNKRAMLALKNQVKKASNQISSLNFDEEKVEDLLAPIKPYIDDSNYWKTIAKSLVIFIAPQFFKIYQVNLNLKDSVHIGHYFDFRALLPLRHFEDFFVLRLSQTLVDLNHVLEAKHSQINLEGLPTNFAEYNRFDDEEKTLQHTSMRTANADSTVFHGHGRPKDHKKDRLEQFVNVVENVVSKFMSSVNKPLVVVGLLPLLSMYKQRNTYGKLERCLEKDPNSISLEALIGDLRHEKYQASLEADQEKAEQILEAADVLPATEDRITEILKRSREGRIKELYIKKQDYVWGEIDGDDAKIFKDHLPRSEDLLTVASVQTLRNGGDVYLFENKDNRPHAVAVLWEAGIQRI